MQWSDETRRSAWRRAVPAGWPFDDPDMFRRDASGRLMYWHDYGDKTSGLGWEVRRLASQSGSAGNGFSDATIGFETLQALNWQSIDSGAEAGSASPFVSDFISRHGKQFPRICEVLKEEPAPEPAPFIGIDEVIAPVMRGLNEN
jgi:hypothetical protein